MLCVVVCGYVAGLVVVVVWLTCRILEWPAFFGPQDVGLAA